MTVNDVIAEIRSMHDQYDQKLPIEQSDIVRWSMKNNLSKLALFDQIGIRLAAGFDRGDLDYDFCDRVVNALIGYVYFGFVSDNSLERPEIFWQVFEAFDDGEYWRKDKPWENPIETYTRPAIASIVREFGAIGEC